MLSLTDELPLPVPFSSRNTCPLILQRLSNSASFLFHSNAPHEASIATKRYPSQETQILFHFHPACTFLAAINNTQPAPIATPAKIFRYRYPPSSFVIKAPAIGFPVRAAMLIVPKVVPIRKPISCTLESCWMRAGVKETKVPEVKPKRAEKIMVRAGVLAGIQRASTNIEDRAVVTIMVLKRPKRSPSQPGIMRPKTLQMK